MKSNSVHAGQAIERMIELSADATMGAPRPAVSAIANAMARRPKVRLGSLMGSELRPDKRGPSWGLT